MTKENNKLEHLAIIMDGNGRWAARRGLPRSMGHRKGAEVVKEITHAAGELGIKYLTLYAFSTENWGRPAQEVDALMELFCKSVVNETPELIRQGVEIRMIGDRTRFDSDIIEGINRLEDETAANTGMTFVIAVNYGGRDEITRAVRHMMMDCQDGKLVPEDVTEQTVASYLDTAGIPDPDLLIRTSGEIRLSNYLLWQLAYSEIYITDCLWPDFNRDELIKAIEQFNQRDRRFGGVKA